MPEPPKILKVRDVVCDGQVIEITVDIGAIKYRLGTAVMRSRQGSITDPDGFVTVTHLRDRGQFFPDEEKSGADQP